ncbi:roadblock/LC7 domain-containing protein [Streptomyces sp. CAU 1734]|uniref:roadblock/LC7 domain-containing protein n=1 Tax=Streptomyces sp. CAU 1734 TaxID=3140360 RepID=UPI0032608C1C
MTSEADVFAEVLTELRRLRARMPQLTGAVAASVDGLVLASDTGMSMGGAGPAAGRGDGTEGTEPGPGTGPDPGAAGRSPGRGWYTDAARAPSARTARVPGTGPGSGSGSGSGEAAGADDSRPGAESLAALTAVALGVAVRLTETTGQGGLCELLVRGEHGCVAVYGAGSAAVLTLLAGPRVNVGRLHLEGRRSGALIGELVDGALKRPGTAPGPSPAPPVQE